MHICVCMCVCVLILLLTVCLCVLYREEIVYYQNHLIAKLVNVEPLVMGLG